MRVEIAPKSLMNSLLGCIGLEGLGEGGGGGKSEIEGRDVGCVPSLDQHRFFYLRGKHKSKLAASKPEGSSSGRRRAAAKQKQKERAAAASRQPRPPSTTTHGVAPRSTFLWLTREK